MEKMMKGTTTVEEDHETTQAPSPLHFVLIHGIRSGGWCWYKICSLMKNSGYKYSCLDLKSAGIDPSDPESVRSFEEYNQPLTDLLSALPENEKVVLVGHSAGGLSVTYASHLFPEKIQLAIYVAATMLRLGFQTDQDIKDGVPDIGDTGKKEPEHSNIVHHMISQEDLMLESLLKKDKAPGQAIRSAKFAESKEIDKVERVYIKTMYDEIMKPWQQDAMVKKWPPSNVSTIESDHVPILSAPRELFNLIVNAAHLSI